MLAPLALMLLASTAAMEFFAEGISDVNQERIRAAVELSLREFTPEDSRFRLRVRALGGATRTLVALEELDASNRVTQRRELYLSPSLEGLEARVRDGLRQLIGLPNVALESASPPRFSDGALAATIGAPEKSGSPLAPILLVSAGIASIAGGVVLGIHGSNRASDLETWPAIDAEFRAIDAERRLSTGLSFGFLGAGLSCLVGAVLLQLLDR